MPPGENARRAWRIAARSRASTHRAPHGPPISSPGRPQPKCRKRVRINPTGLGRIRAVKSGARLRRRHRSAEMCLSKTLRRSAVGARCRIQARRVGEAGPAIKGRATASAATGMGTPGGAGAASGPDGDHPLGGMKATAHRVLDAVGEQVGYVDILVLPVTANGTCLCPLGAKAPRLTSCRLEGLLEDVESALGGLASNT
jgi:hypothetical protein